MFGRSSCGGLAKNKPEQDYARQKQLFLKAIVWTYMSLFSLHKNKKREQKHNGREQLWQPSKIQTRARTCSVEAAVTVYKGLHMQDMCVENLGLYSMEDAGILEPSFVSFQKDAFMFYEKLSCWLQNSTTDIYAGVRTFEILYVCF